MRISITMDRHILFSQVVGRLLILVLIVASMSMADESRAKRQIVFPGRVSDSHQTSRNSANSHPNRAYTHPTTTKSSGQIFAQCTVGECLPPIFCRGLIGGTTLKSTMATCHLSDRSTGVCCNRDLQSPSGTPRFPFSGPDKRVDVGFIGSEEVQNAAAVANKYLTSLEETNRRLLEQQVFVRRNTANAGHLNFFRASPLTQELGNRALQNTQATRTLQQRFRLTPDQGGFGLHQVNVRETSINTTCIVPPDCQRRGTQLYRSADGSCNNLAHPSWGQANTGLQRILAPDYADGIFSPRRASDGGRLPSARRVSNRVTGSSNNPYTDLTISLMTWGQFLDHDLSISPIFRLQDSRGIECCDENGHHLPNSLKHPQCLPIDVDSNDAFYSRFGRITCMNFVRSLLAPRPNCDLGYAEQLNAITHYLDASQVYGSDDEQAAALRSFRGGLLLESAGATLPHDRRTEQDECFAHEQGGECFRAGDGRVNENLQLTLMHTLWLREHNRVAGELKKLVEQQGRSWSDERLYQEARRVVIAEWQHITYHEWLPIVIGNQFMDVYGLDTKGSGYSGDYRDSINPSINNEFSSAAFRFGHTLVESMVHLFRDSQSRTGALKLRDVLNNPSLMSRRDIISDMARGFHLQTAQKFDANVADDLRNHLFQPPRGNHGMDLVALNIQRAREHGIPSYNEMRAKCGLRRVNSFDELARSGEIPQNVVRRMQSVYTSVDDIDLFVAGIAERPVPGALLGHTFLCIVGDQFARIKKGDRFFYDLGGQPHSLSQSQLFEVRKTSWARILCDNMPSMNEVQPMAFFVPNYYNKLTSCRSYSIPQVSLGAFV